MWPLLQKEWYFIKPLIVRLMLLGLPVFLFFLFLSARLGSEGVVAGMTSGLSFLLVYSFILQSAYREETGLAFLRSLPVNCGVIVGAKFLVMILLGVTAIFMAFAILLVSGLTGIISPEMLDDFWTNGLSSLASVLIMGSVILWTFFRFGYSKISWALVVIFLLLPCLIVAVGFLTLKNFPGIYVVFSAQEFVIAMLLIAFTVFAACFFDSVRALKSRDFN